MPKIISPLTEQQVTQSLPGDRPRKLFDGSGLYLDLMPSGAKTWRMKYRDQLGKAQTLTFGRFPEVSLGLARNRREVARDMLRNGHDPRTEFNAGRLSPKPPAPKHRQLPETIEAQQLRRLCKQAGEAALEHMFETVFPSLLRIAGDEVAQDDVRELMRKIRHDHLKELTDVLSGLCTEFASDCIDAGISGATLNAAMTDARGAPRWTRST